MKRTVPWKASTANSNLCLIQENITAGMDWEVWKNVLHDQGFQYKIYPTHRATTDWYLNDRLFLTCNLLPQVIPFSIFIKYKKKKKKKSAFFLLYLYKTCEWGRQWTLRVSLLCSTIIHLLDTAKPSSTIMTCNISLVSFLHLEINFSDLIAHSFFQFSMTLKKYALHTFLW